MIVRTKPLPNHRAGVREVMLDSNGHVLPVISATRVSYTPDCVTSYQRPTVDGYVIRSEDKNGNAVITVNRYVPHMGTITPVTEDFALVEKILSSLDTDLVQWLKDVVDRKESNLLPAGFGWDGIMTQTEYSKYSRVRDLFISPTTWSAKDAEWFEKIVHQAVRTSTMYLNLDWDKSFKLCNNLIPVHRYLPTDTKVYLVTFDKDGNRAVNLIRRPIFANGNKGNVPELAAVPKGTVKAILLRTNVMVDETTSYGVSIDLYSTST